MVVHDRVPDLAGPGAVALEQSSAQDEAGTDAAPDTDRNEVRDPIAAGVGVFGERCGLRVIGNVDRDRVPLGDDLAEGQVPPVEVDRPADRPGPRVHEARGPDPDPEQRCSRAVEELIEELEDQAERGVAVPPVDRQLDGPADLAPEVDERSGEMLLAEVETDDQARVVVDLEQDRRLAAARRTPPDLAHDAVVEERGDDVGDGGPGQARLAGDVGAADRPEVVDRADDEPLVVDAGLLMGRFGRERHRPPGSSSLDSRRSSGARLRPVDGQSDG